MRVEAEQPLARSIGREMQQQPADHVLQRVELGLILAIRRLVRQPSRDARAIDAQDACDLALPAERLGKVAQLGFAECGGRRHATILTQQIMLRQA